MYKSIIGILVIAIVSLFIKNFNSYYDEKEIRLGMSGPFSGNMYALGTEFFTGADAYLKHINDQGGINGRTFRIIKKDDKYEPKITEENAKELIERYRVFALFGFIGTPTSKVALPIAVKSRTPYLGAFSGADFLRTVPRNPLVLNARTSYKKEIEKLVEYFADIKKYKKIAVFYQNDSYGRSGLRGVKKALQKRKMKLAAEGSYKRNTLSVGHALYEIANTHPEVTIIVGSTKPTAEFIKRARENKKTKDMKFGVISFVGSNFLLKILKEDSKNITFSQVVSSPLNQISPEVGLYRDLMDKYYPNKEYSYVSLEGYFAARMTVELFKRAGKNFTKEDFIDEMENLYLHMQATNMIDSTKRACKCLNNVYLTSCEDGIFWDVDEKNN